MNSENANLLYTSHLLSTWNSRVFAFGSVLFLAALYPGTLFPVSLYALCSMLPGAFFGGAFGHYIDTTDRLSVVRWSILGQRFAVMAACLLFLYPLQNRYVMLGLLAVLGGCENSWSIINTVSVERDWVVVVAASDVAALRTMNSTMRFIDLSCKLLGPFLIGMIDGIDNRAAIVTVLNMSAVSVGVEYFAIARIYWAVPALASRKRAAPTVNEEEPTSEEEPLAPDSEQQPFSYWRHPLLLFSLAYNLSYVTVLSFGGQMVAYLLAAGMEPHTLTLFRTFSVIVELSATLMAPSVITLIGPFKAAIAFIDFEGLVLLLTTVWFVALKRSARAAWVLALGVAVSRIGLWGFDLSTQIVIQDGVKESERGKFSSVEKSLQNWAQILVFVTTMVFSRPDQFKWPMALSVAAVGSSAVLFTVAWLRLRR